jgi:hypothetical protein
MCLFYKRLIRFYSKVAIELFSQMILHYLRVFEILNFWSIHDLFYFLRNLQITLKYGFNNDI